MQKQKQAMAPLPKEWGTAGHLTAEQERAAATLAGLVKENSLPARYQSHAAHLRFLRARGFNVTKAYALLKQDADWREQFSDHVFVASRDFPPVAAMHSDGAIRLAGQSLDGRPIIVLQPRFFWPKLVEDPLQIVYFFVFYVDRLCARAEQAGQETFVTIADLEGFSMSNFSLTYVKVVVSVLQNHYPERLGSVFVVNAPFIFAAAWRMIQPLLDERTRSKIDVLGSSPADVARLHAEVAPDVLERGLGGSHERYAVPDDVFQQAMVLDTTPSSVADSAPVTPRSGNSRRRIKHLLKRALFSTEARASSSSLGLDPNRDDDAGAVKPSGILKTMSRRLWAREQSVDDDAEDIRTSRDERVAIELREAHDRLLVQMATLATQHETQIMQLQHQVHALAVLLVAVLLYSLLFA